MKHKMQKALSDFSMLCDGDSVVVALSGGADSVALLYSLNSIKEIYNITLYACHINHLIRGDEAYRDEQFVVSLCKSLGIELFVKRVDVPLLAKEEKLSLELCGRKVRYEFFHELSEKLNAKVATAHTASDNVETVLYNIARGTSLNGLCGIKPVRDYIIRPLILCSRDDVERYCNDNLLEYVTDSTNLSDDYTRNNIRHNAVPTLKSINADLEATVARMCSSLTDIKKLIDEYSEKELKNCKTKDGYSAEKLLSLDNAILSSVLCMIAEKNKVLLSGRHVELITDCLQNGGCVDLYGDYRAVCKQGVFRIVNTAKEKVDIDMAFKDCCFVEYISQEEIKNINKNFLNNLISCDIITDDTRIRTKREGDTFTFYKRNVTKTLKKLLNEMKVPAENRDSLLVVANDSTVLWLEGVGTSKQGRADERSRGAYKVNRG